MRKLTVILVLLAMLLGMSGCASEAANMELSDEILLSFSIGGGYGDEIDSMSQTVFICKDATVKLVVSYPEETEILSFALTEEEYKAVEKLASPKKILRIEESRELFPDCSQRSICLYGPDGEVIVKKWEYYRSGSDMWEICSAIEKILEPYDIYGCLREYEASLRAAENNE